MRNREELIAELMQTLWIFLGVGLLVLVGVWLLLRLRSQLQDDAGSATTSHEMLTRIRDLHRQGDLSEEEYRSIKGRLVGRLDRSRSVQRPPGSDPPPESAAGQPAGDGPDDEHAVNDHPDDPQDGNTAAGDEARR